MRKQLASEVATLAAVLVIVFVVNLAFGTTVPAWSYVLLAVAWTLVRVQDVRAKRRKRHTAER